MVEARILAGLPPYGEPAISFPEPNTFREGVVVEFRSNTERWVGNFAGFWDGLESSVHSELGEHAVVVVAAGHGYVVNAITRTLVRDIQMDVLRIWFEAELEAMVISNDLWFAAFNATDVLWRSRRISWDRMRNVECYGLTVSGEASDPTRGGDDWVAFSLDLRSGEVRGGSYNGPPM